MIHNCDSATQGTKPESVVSAMTMLCLVLWADGETHGGRGSAVGVPLING